MVVVYDIGDYTVLFYIVQVDDGTVPPTSTVRKFLALLEQSDIDFSEELGIFSSTFP